MHKAFLENIVSRQVEKKNKENAPSRLLQNCYDALKYSTEVFLGDLTELPFHHIHIVEKMTLADHIPVDLSFLEHPTNPFPATSATPVTLLTWTDKTIAARGFTRNLFWGLLDARKDAGKHTLAVYCGAALRKIGLLHFFTSMEMAKIRLEPSGVYMDLDENFIKNMQTKKTSIGAALEINLYALLYIIDYAKKIYTNPALQYSPANECYVFSESIGETTYIPKNFLEVKFVEKPQNAATKKVRVPAVDVFDEIQVVGAKDE